MPPDQSKALATGGEVGKAVLGEAQKATRSTTSSPPARRDRRARE